MDAKYIALFLGGGLIAGMGPATAEKIAAKFGDGCFDVLENHPEKLAQLPRVSIKMARKICANYQTVKHLREVLLFLYQFDLGHVLADKIYRHYGDATIVVVKKNPYALTETIDGVGFLTVSGACHHPATPIRSITIGTPNWRTPPSGFGIYTHFTGLGLYQPPLILSHNSR